MTSSEYPKQYYQNQTNWSDADEVNISTGNQTGIDFTVVTPKTLPVKLHLSMQRLEMKPCNCRNPDL
jgi:hypothetical protein